MRDIEFRIKNNKNNWVYFTVFHNGINVKNFKIETLGEWTGLKDKNNTKIFKGDVVKFHINGESSGSTRIGIVRYSKRRGAYMFKDGNTSLLIALNIPSSLCITDPEPNFEVIGNIYENNY